MKAIKNQTVGSAAVPCVFLDNDKKYIYKASGTAAARARNQNQSAYIQDYLAKCIRLIGGNTPRTKILKFAEFKKLLYADGNQAFVRMLENARMTGIILRTDFLTDYVDLVRANGDFTLSGFRETAAVLVAERLFDIEDRHDYNYMVYLFKSKVKHLAAIDLETCGIINSTFSKSSSAYSLAMKKLLKTDSFVDDAYFVQGVKDAQTKLTKNKDKIMKLTQAFEKKMNLEVRSLSKRIDLITGLKPIELSYNLNGLANPTRDYVSSKHSRTNVHLP